MPSIEEIQPSLWSESVPAGPRKSVPAIPGSQPLAWSPWQRISQIPLPSASLPLTLAATNPLLRRAALILESHNRPTIHFQGRHEEAHARKQLSTVKLGLRHDSPRHLPTGG